jgi:hypothetical protein
MPTVIEGKPELERQWRAIVLRGRNVASYKFALAQALLEIPATGKTVISLDDLAVPFARHICGHLKGADKQGQFASSKFLDACRSFNRGELDLNGLHRTTARLGFQNVIDAFHIVGQDPVPNRFFVDERKGLARGIRLTDDLFRLAEQFQGHNYPIEVEARWRLVETAWELNLPAAALCVTYDNEVESLTVDANNGRRVSITGCRDALVGYQRGRCFYCGREMKAGEADVDHFLPHTLRSDLSGLNINGVWNLVLACVDCNRGPGGKFDRRPSQAYLHKLHARNEFYVSSHHPLRETIMNQAGLDEPTRQRFLHSAWDEAGNLLIHSWEPRSTEVPPDVL